MKHDYVVFAGILWAAVTVLPAAAGQNGPPAQIRTNPDGEVRIMDTGTTQAQPAGTCRLSRTGRSPRTPASKPDLTWVPAQISHNFTSQLYINVRIENLGTETAAENQIGYYLSSDDKITKTDICIGTNTVPAITGGSSTPTVLGVDVSDHPGTWYVGFIIDENNVVDETDEKNNAHAFTPPDVLLSNLYVIDTEVTKSDGPNIHYDFYVDNDGYISTITKPDYAVFLSPDQSYDPSDYLIEEGELICPLDPEDYMGHTSFTTVSGVPGGEYYLIVIIDFKGLIDEQDENDNMDIDAVNKVTIPAGFPDLVVSQINITDNEGPDISYIIDVMNIGTDPTSGSFKNIIYLSNDTDITAGDYRINDWNITQTVAAGDYKRSWEISTSVTGVPPGDYYLGVIADAEGDIDESDETNNAGHQLSPEITIPGETPEPDTCVGNMLVNGNFADGTNNWLLSVQGDGQASGSVQNGEYVVSIGNGSTEDWHIQVVQTGLLMENGAEYSVSFEAHAAASRDLNNAVMKYASPWTAYSGWHNFSLTTTRQYFTYTFVMTEPTSSDGAMIFNTGASLHDVYLDNICLVKTSSATDVAPDNPARTVSTFALCQNYPNPFNPSTVIRYQVPEECVVSLKIHDLMGKEVAAPAFGKQAAGVHEVTWHAGDLPGGVYFCRLNAGSYTETRKLILQK